MNNPTKSTVLLAAMILISAFSFARAVAVEYYAASPADVPEWAKQGTFQFIRIDGGLIESMKAERTHWGREFSPEEMDVLTNIYTKYQDKIFEKLKEAGFNWVWVTWSNGWSFEEEKESRRQLRKFIERAHAEGIKVTTYLSATNIFWESTLKDEPESITWMLIQNGRPVNYGGPMNPLRFIADIKNPDWRKYMLKKAAAALDAGADAVFFDNVIGDGDGLKTLFSQFQGMAASRAKKNGTPKVPLYVNAHQEPDRLDINDVCDIVWDEYGITTPGVWPDKGWDVSNVRKTRFIQGGKYSWQPQKYEQDRYYCGPREKCFPDPTGQKLSIAEAWAFGSSLSRNIEGKFLKSLILGEKEGLDAWAAIAQYNKWINTHNNIYTDVTPVARIAVFASHDGRGSSGFPEHGLAESLLKSNAMFGTKISGRLDRGAPLSSYKVLAIPGGTSDISPADSAELEKFASSGGKVFIAPSGGELEKKISFKSIAPETAAKLENVTVAAPVISEIVEASGGPVVTVSGGDYLLASVMKKNSEPVFFVHIINYAHDAISKNVKVTLDMGADASKYKILLMSPDGGGVTEPGSSSADNKIAFTIPEISHYSVAVVVPESYSGKF